MSSVTRRRRGTKASFVIVSDTLGLPFYLCFISLILAVFLGLGYFYSSFPALYLMSPSFRLAFVFDLRLHLGREL